MSGDMMRYCKNEKGIALVTALMLTLIGLAMVLVVVYFVTQGTKISGIQKRYQTSLAASHGGTELLSRDIIPKTLSGTNLSTLIYLGFGGQNLITDRVLDACFNAKLTMANSGTNWTGANCIVTNLLEAKTNYDVKLTLPGTPPQADFDVYTKIVDTNPGNSNTSDPILEGTGVVESGSGVITPQHFPYMYRIEVQGERQNSPERSNLSVLYAY
jgi:hypothetical protein